MSFLVAKGRSFLTFGRSTGKHAARRGIANMALQPDSQQPKPRRPAHAASMPRLDSQEKAA